MDTQVEGVLPFKVGQLAESRTFQSGFRGAWFRCKIKEISCRKGNMEFALEFYDYSDDKKAKWTRIYQVPQIGRKRAMKVGKMLMVRPHYPPIRNESEVAHVNTISKVTVVRNVAWKVGDLVDWWYDSCYWSGRVTQILGDDKVQIELPPPPIGEGSSYDDVPCNVLRPSLDWSPEHGWSVPTSQEGEQNYHPCARLIMPLDQGLPIGTVDVGIQNVGATAGLMHDASFLSPISTKALPSVDKSKQPIEKELTGQPLSIIAIPEEEVHRPQPSADLDIRESAIGKTGLSQRIGNVEVARYSSREDKYYSGGAAKKIRTSGNTSLNSMSIIAIPEEEAHRPQPSADLDIRKSAIGNNTGFSQRIENVEEARNSSREDEYYSGGAANKKIRTGGNTSLNSMRTDTIEAPIIDLEELVNKVKWLKGILESGVPLPKTRRYPWKFVERYGSSVPE